MTKHPHHRKEHPAGEPAQTPAAPPPAEAAAEQPVEEAAGEHLVAELAAAKDRVLRLGAELDNFRKRAEREIAEERRYAQLPLIRDLLPVLDNVYRAIEAGEKSPSGEGLLAGVRMVAEQLEAVLKRHHCVRIPAAGVAFDPHFHEAIAQHTSHDFPAKTVMAVTQEGYRLYDRVVRPSQVVVSSGPPSTDNQPTTNN